MQVDDILNSIKLQDIKAEAFKRGFFDFIVDTPKGRHLKQEEALRVLTDDFTEEFLYGGAAGGAKSWTGASWLLFSAYLYPDTRWFIGREELKRITESTLITFFKVAKEYGMMGEFKFNAQKNFIQFRNGSRIDLLELKYLPRDPMFERFGSTEYTGGWIEEAGEIDFGAYDVLRTRIGRQHNEKYGLIGKLFITANPKKNWIYSTFYVPWKAGKLEPFMHFLQAFVYDNPHIDKGYIERLKRTKDKVKRERLLKGNWEYDDDPTALCTYDAILSILTNNHVQRTGKRYITADIARYGSDKAIIVVWDGWVIIDVKIFDKSSTVLIQDTINELRVKYQIPANQCIADEDGVGGGVVDNCKIKGFVNGSVALKEKIGGNVKETPKYRNLQTQCGYKVADVINAHGMYIEYELPEKEKEAIKEDLGELKRDKVDDDTKLYLKSKEDIKKDIGRSPDWRDVILMRYWFELEIPFEMAMN